MYDALPNVRIQGRPQPDLLYNGSVVLDNNFYSKFPL
jgi:hypothetical protein